MHRSGPGRERLAHAQRHGGRFHGGVVTELRAGLRENMDVKCLELLAGGSPYHRSDLKGREALGPEKAARGLWSPGGTEALAGRSGRPSTPRRGPWPFPLEPEQKSEVETSGENPKHKSQAASCELGKVRTSSILGASRRHRLSEAAWKPRTAF